MAAVHLQNVVLTPIPSYPSFVGGRGHRPDYSAGSTASGTTASDSGRQAGNSTSNSQLLGNSQHRIAADTSIPLQLHYSYPQRELKSTSRIGSRTMRKRIYARLGLTAAVLCWVIYCTVRYFIAIRIYRGDHVRSRYALGMGITSAFTIVFFASESSITLRFSNNQFYRRLKVIVHLLAYLSSALVLGLTIINIVLVNVWRTPNSPAQFGRSVEGRCHWDLDVVWSGTGMACAERGAKPFGDWLGAAIVRSVVSAVLMIAYHLTMHGHAVDREAQQTSAAGDTDMGELADGQPSIPAMRPLLSRSHRHNPSLVPVSIILSEDDHQRRSLSFTAAGQVLSRIEGSELDGDDHSSTTPSSSDQHQRLEDLVHPHISDRDAFVSPLSESPEALSPIESIIRPLDSDRSSYLSQLSSSQSPGPESGESAPNPRLSTYLRSIAPPSNDLQDFASAFRNFVSNFTRDTTEGLTLNTTPGSSRHTVHVLGSNISRMSTIDSMSSRGAGSALRNPSRSDTPRSNGSGSRNLSRNSTTSSHDRGQHELLTSSFPSGTGSADGCSPP